MLLDEVLAEVLNFLQQTTTQCVQQGGRDEEEKLVERPRLADVFDGGDKALLVHLNSGDKSVPGRETSTPSCAPASLLPSS